eukprot:jgi/Undpi1/2209/HiC_scaffold_12.g05595.m1
MSGGKRKMSPDEPMQLEPKVEALTSRLPDSSYDDDDDLMDPDQQDNMDMARHPVSDRCDTCAPDKCSECIICHQGSKVQRCGADGCRMHFHPWCMSHHSGLPEPLVYWGHIMLNSDREALIPYHYCHHHKDQVPHASREDIMWHLPSKQITRNRRGKSRQVYMLTHFQLLIVS